MGKSIGTYYTNELKLQQLSKQSSSYDECKLAAIRGILVNYAHNTERSSYDFLEDIIDVVGMSSKDLKEKDNEQV